MPATDEDRENMRQAFQDALERTRPKITVRPGSGSNNSNGDVIELTYRGDTVSLPTVIPNVKPPRKDIT